MKRMVLKIFAILGLLASAACFICLIISAVYLILPDDPTESMHKSVPPWVFSVLLMIPALVCYGLDGIVSVIKILKKRDFAFNLVLVLIIVAAAPMFFMVGGKGDLASIVIWNLYHAILFATEIISVIRALKGN